MINYNLEIIILISCVVLTTTYFVKSSLIKSPPIETPNSPQTFNLSHDQIKELNTILDSGGELSQAQNLKLDQDVETMLGKENYSQFIQDMKQIELDSMKELHDILNSISNSGIDFQNILDLINFITNFF
jgi:hypothetical protein